MNIANGPPGLPGRPADKAAASAARHRERLDMEVGGVQLSLAVMRGGGTAAPILFLHGFGSTKEDFADAVLHEHLRDHQVCAFDAPGFGRSHCDRLDAIDMDFLVQTAERVVSHYELDRYHLVGHSMGGLAALLLADAQAHRVLSFTNIEGNLAPEDCFLSRQIIEYSGQDAATFLARFAERSWHAPGFAAALYAERLRDRVRSGVCAPIFRSMVEWSDQGRLLERFLGLRCPRLFMHGEANRSLSYLRQLRNHGVQIAAIPFCGHFPMYSNPPAMWQAIGRFIKGLE